MKIDKKIISGRLGKYCKGFIVIGILVALCFAFYSIFRLNETIDLGNREVILNYSNLISKRLHDRFEIIDKSLEDLINDFEEEQITSDEALLEKLLSAKSFWEVSECGVMYENGDNVISDGSKIQFEKEIRLNDVISYAENLNISTQNILSKPMFVLAKPYNSSNIRGIFAVIEMDTLVSFLGDFGYSDFSLIAIANTNGDNEWKQGEELIQSGNCFVDLESVKISDDDSILQMREKMRISLPGDLSYEKDGEKYFLAHVPLEINDWHLLISVQSGTIDATAVSREYIYIAGVLIGVICIMGVIGVFYLYRRNIDVLENNRKLHEATVLANQANDAKRDFLAKVSHEIRTPLNGVMGMINLAKNNNDDKGKLLLYLDKALASADYLLQILNDVLDMSHIESGKQRISEGTVDLLKMKTEIVDLMEESSKKKNIDLKIDDHNLIHHYFIGDYVRIKQIILNLIANAIKYTENGGHVNVTIFEEKIVDNNKDIDDYERSNMIIEVNDNGCGIALEKQEVIFNAFEQDNLGLQGGVGLGLPIVKSFTELMNGTITLESEVGVGSTFTVTIPLRPLNIDEVKIEEFKSKNLNGIQILLAEDNEVNAEIAVELLKERGANITLVTDGEKMVEAFKNSPVGFYDVILADIQMPNKNGIEATRDIRALNRSDAKSIIILAMTADAFAEQKNEMIKAGMNDILFKPINIDGVCISILKYLESIK